jgi:hypothetical protein
MRSLGDIVNDLAGDVARRNGVALLRPESGLPAAAEAEFTALLAAARALAEARVDPSGAAPGILAA